MRTHLHWDTIPNIAGQAGTDTRSGLCPIAHQHCCNHTHTHTVCQARPQRHCAGTTTLAPICLRPLTPNNRDCLCVSDTTTTIWAGPGKGAEQAVYDIGLYDAMHQAEGQSALTAAVDIAKCFEQVQQDLIWQSALTLASPLSILRVVLEVYQTPRVIRCCRAVSFEVTISCGIVAGDNFATFVLWRVPLPAVHS